MPNEFVIEGDTAFLLMIHYDEPYRIPISVCDLQVALAHRWSIAEKEGYQSVISTPKINGKQKTLVLARFLLGVDHGLEVDHIDRDPLNNRRSNLRIATRHQNAQNRSPNGEGKFQARGVTLRHGYFIARVTLHGQRYFLGAFPTVALARTAAADFRRDRMPYSSEASQ